MERVNNATWCCEQIEEKLKGNLCGTRSTSCADQLAIAVREAFESKKA